MDVLWLGLVFLTVLFIPCSGTRESSDIMVRLSQGQQYIIKELKVLSTANKELMDKVIETNTFLHNAMSANFFSTKGSKGPYTKPNVVNRRRLKLESTASQHVAQHPSTKQSHSVVGLENLVRGWGNDPHAIDSNGRAPKMSSGLTSHKINAALKRKGASLNSSSNTEQQIPTEAATTTTKEVTTAAPAKRLKEYDITNIRMAMATGDKLVIQSLQGRGMLDVMKFSLKISTLAYDGVSRRLYLSCGDKLSFLDENLKQKILFKTYSHAPIAVDGSQQTLYFLRKEELLKVNLKGKSGVLLTRVQHSHSARPVKLVFDPKGRNIILLANYRRSVLLTKINSVTGNISQSIKIDSHHVNIIAFAAETQEFFYCDGKGLLVKIGLENRTKRGLHGWKCPIGTRHLLYHHEHILSITQTRIFVVQVENGSRMGSLRSFPLYRKALPVVAEIITGW